MKYLCPGCDRLVEVGAFGLDAGTLVLRCPRCGEDSRAAPAEGARPTPEPAMPPPPARSPFSPGAPNVVPLRPGASEAVRLAAEAAASADPFRIPEGRCPKCFARREGDGPSCATCGLTFALFEPGAQRPPEGLAGRWVELLAKWDDAALHEQMLQLGVARNELAIVGRLYRGRLAFTPDDPVAQHGRDEVVRLATAHAAAVPATGEPDRVTAQWKLGAALVVVLLGLGAVLAIIRRLAAVLE